MTVIWFHLNPKIQKQLLFTLSKLHVSEDDFRSKIYVLEKMVMFLYEENTVVSRQSWSIKW